MHASRDFSIDPILASTDVANYFFEYALEQKERQKISLTNSSWYLFYKNNIDRTLASQLAEMSDRKYIARFLNGTDHDILLTLYHAYKNKFPTKAEKQKFVAYFSQEKILQIENIYVWQLVFSRAFDMMGIAESLDPKKNQFVTVENLDIFKNFLQKLNSFVCFVSITEEDLAAHPLGLPHSYHLASAVMQLGDMFKAADQKELEEGIKTYYFENYKPDLKSSHGETYGNHRDKLLKQELGELVDSLSKQTMREIKKLYTEDRKTGRWAISVLKNNPRERLLLDDFRLMEPNTNNKKWFVGQIYALSKLEVALTQLFKEIDFMDEVEENYKTDYKHRIKMAILINASNPDGGIDAVKNLLAKFNNLYYRRMILMLIGNTLREQDCFVGYLLALFDRLRHWSVYNIDGEKFDYEVIMKTLHDQFDSDQNMLAYAFRPKSLLWTIDSTFLIKFLFRRRGIHSDCVDDRLLTTLSDSQDAINRLYRLGSASSCWNQLSNKLKNSRISNLLYLIKLPNCLFELFADLEALRALESFDLDWRGQSKFKEHLCEQYVKIRNSCGLIEIYEKEINRHSHLNNFFPCSEIMKNLLAECSVEQMFSLTCRYLSQAIPLIPQAYIDSTQHSILSVLFDLLMNNMASEEILDIIKFVIANVENDAVVACLNKLYKQGIDNIVQNKEVLFAVVMSEKNPKRKRDEESDEFIADESDESSSSESQMPKKPKRR